MHKNIAIESRIKCGGIGRGKQTMLYQGYQILSDLLEPARFGARAAMTLRDEYPGTLTELPMAKRFFAACEVFEGARATHARPPFAIDEVMSGNQMVPVREEVMLDLPFGSLLHFAKDDVATPQPKMLVVAPLSGHFATLLRNTVHTLLRDHDVYITDWRNARDIPVGAGRWGFEDYVDYIITFLQELGPRSHVLAVCQPCVPTLAAVALMAEDKDPSEPRTMTLMGGPVDTREAPTVVNALAMSKSMDGSRRR
jgi:poly(3-hydroxybutyrate) depolymerase